MDMVVHVLASDDWGDGMAFLLPHLPAALKLGGFLLETSLDRLRIAMLVFPVFYGNHVVVVLFW